MANPNPKTDHLTPFKKGQSGNPDGRPKGRIDFKTALQHYLCEEGTLPEAVKNKLNDIQPGLGEKIGVYGLAIAGILKAIEKGDQGAIDKIVDRLDGPVQRNLDITSKGESMTEVNTINYGRLDDSDSSE